MAKKSQQDEDERNGHDLSSASSSSDSSSSSSTSSGSGSSSSSSSSSSDSERNSSPANSPKGRPANSPKRRLKEQEIDTERPSRYKEERPQSTEPPRKRYRPSPPLGREPSRDRRDEGRSQEPARYTNRVRHNGERLDRNSERGPRRSYSPYDDRRRPRSPIDNDRDYGRQRYQERSKYRDMGSEKAYNRRDKYPESADRHGRESRRHDQDGRGRDHRRSGFNQREEGEFGGRDRHFEGASRRDREQDAYNGKRDLGRQDSQGRNQKKDRDDVPQSKEVWGVEGNRPPPPKEEKEVKPDFGLSGALADETNKVNGVTLVYQEPPEAANTNLRWRLYTFKGGDLVGEPLYLHRQSSYLFGRERRVVDVPTDHPSCSKQHAVFQYRRTSKVGEDGVSVEGVRPYLMDLGSTNGTFINSERLESQRFYEVLEKDVMKMGHSSREYVLLHEGSIN